MQVPPAQQVEDYPDNMEEDIEDDPAYDLLVDHCDMPVPVAPPSVTLGQKGDRGGRDEMRAQAHPGSASEARPIDGALETGNRDDLIVVDEPNGGEPLEPGSKRRRLAPGIEYLRDVVWEGEGQCVYRVRAFCAETQGFSFKNGRFQMTMQIDDGTAKASVEMDSSVVESLIGVSWSDFKGMSKAEQKPSKKLLACNLMNLSGVMSIRIFRAHALEEARGIIEEISHRTLVSDGHRMLERVSDALRV